MGEKSTPAKNQVLFTPPGPQPVNEALFGAFSILKIQFCEPGEFPAVLSSKTRVPAAPRHESSDKLQDKDLKSLSGVCCGFLTLTAVNLWKSIIAVLSATGVWCR